MQVNIHQSFFRQCLAVALFAKLFDRQSFLLYGILISYINTSNKYDEVYENQLCMHIDIEIPNLNIQYFIATLPELDNSHIRFTQQG